MKVLHWPKLFDGLVCPEGRPAKNGDGYGNGNGSFNGGRSDIKGGGAYADSEGDGWSRRSV